MTGFRGFPADDREGLDQRRLETDPVELSCITEGLRDRDRGYSTRRSGSGHRDSVSEPRARTFFFHALDRLGSIPLTAGVLGFTCGCSPALPLQLGVEGAVQGRVYARSAAR